MLYAEPQVRAGILFLDERMPGWRCKISIQNLRMRQAEKCVLGQLFGDYDIGRECLGLMVQQAIDFGFFRGDDITWPVAPHELVGAELSTWTERYAMLEETWKTLLVEGELFGR